MGLFNNKKLFRSLSRSPATRLPAMNGTEVANPPPPPSSGYGYYQGYPREQQNLAPKQKVNFYILESESSQESENEESETLSIQGKETDLVKDTSDTDWSTDHEVGSVIEYDVVSSSEEKIKDLPLQIMEGDGSSETDDNIVATTVISFEMIEDGDFDSADSEESSASVSELIPKQGYSSCAQCKNTHNNPMFRYCVKCYKERKDFFPPRPKRKRPKASKIKKQQSNGCRSSKDEVKSITPNLDFENIIVPNSLKNDRSVNICNTDGANKMDTKNHQEGDNFTPFRKRSMKAVDEVDVKRMRVDECSSESVIKDNYFKSETLELDSQDLTSFSQPSISMCAVQPSKSLSEPGIALTKKELEMIRESTGNYSDNESNIALKKAMVNTQVGSDTGASSKTSSDFDLCIVCMVERKSGIFAHGRIGHICCCYKCSMKVWVKTKRCPMCKCKVSNVLRACF